MQAALEAETFYTPSEAAEREAAAVKVQAVIRGKLTRSKVQQDVEAARRVEAEKRRMNQVMAQKKAKLAEARQELMHGKEGQIESLPATRVKKVSQKGDPTWFNRCVHC